MDFKSPFSWTPQEQALLLSSLLALREDVESSKGGREKEYETNPLLPRKPSNQDFDKIGLLTGGLGTIGAALLPDKYRASALGAWTGAELAISEQNKALRRGSKQEGGINYPLILATLGGYLLGDTIGDSLTLGTVQGVPTVAFKKDF